MGAREVGSDALNGAVGGAKALHTLATMDPRSVKGGIVSQALFEYMTLKIGANSAGAIGYDIVPSEMLWTTRIYAFTNPFNVDTVFSGATGELINIK